MSDDLLIDVVVIGAGPVGLTTALALAALGTHVAIAAPDPEATWSDADRRTTALLPGSVDLLKNLGVWTACGQESAPLEGVRIVDARGTLLRAPEVLFKAEELGAADLGANIANSALVKALHDKTRSVSRLRWVPTAGVSKVEPGPDHVRVALVEGGSLRTRLAVAADGRNSITRTAAGIATRSWSYQQSAIAATFCHTRPHGGVSMELHRRAGPLTTVPLRGNASSLVWVESPEQADRLARSGEAQFLAELGSHLQGALGRLSALGPRAAYPLAGLDAVRMGQNRVALVGEAAHVMPPIGAQGLNLGLRDAAALAQCVAATRNAGQDIGGPEALQAYDTLRAADVLARKVSVDLLNRSLLVDFLPVQALRGVGLHLLANIGPLRRLLMQAGAGAPGAPLRLMQPHTPSTPLDAGAVAGQFGSQ